MMDTDPNPRPIWILVDGWRPVALVALKRRLFPSNARHWCHEGDAAWSPLSDDDRARLERRTRSRPRRRKAADRSGAAGAFGKSAENREDAT